MFDHNETLEEARARNIRDALFEDIGVADWTARLVPANQRVRAQVRVREAAGYSKTGVGDIGLYNTGANGEYMVMSGSSWLPDKNGRPVILRIK